MAILSSQHRSLSCLALASLAAAVVLLVGGCLPAGAGERPLFRISPVAPVTPVTDAIDNSGVRVFKPTPRRALPKAQETPVANPYALSCDEARREVRAHGFRDVEDIDCGKAGYRFKASRKGARYILNISPVDGSMVTRRR